MAARAEVQVTQLLGGRKVLGRVSEAGDLLRAVRDGLPYASLESLTRQLGVETSAIGGVERARTWLGRANRSLGGASPMSLLDTACMIPLRGPEDEAQAG